MNLFDIDWEWEWHISLTDKLKENRLRCMGMSLKDPRCSHEKVRALKVEGHRRGKCRPRRCLAETLCKDMVVYLVFWSLIEQHGMERFL